MIVKTLLDVIEVGARISLMPVGVKVVNAFSATEAGITLTAEVNNVEVETRLETEELVLVLVVIRLLFVTKVAEANIVIDDVVVKVLVATKTLSEGMLLTLVPIRSENAVM